MINTTSLEDFEKTTNCWDVRHDSLVKSNPNSSKMVHGKRPKHLLHSHVVLAADYRPRTGKTPLLVLGMVFRQISKADCRICKSNFNNSIQLMKRANRNGTYLPITSLWDNQVVYGKKSDFLNENANFALKNLYTTSIGYSDFVLASQEEYEAASSKRFLIKIWKHLDTFRGEISTWLYRIAYNTAITFSSKEKRLETKYTSALRI
jgi:hypothetical protein